MYKKILIGSIIAVVILLLMPSIPAIQNQFIQESEEKTILDDVKLPILFQFVLKWFDFRYYRIDYLDNISFDRYLIDEDRNLYEYDIYHPVLFIRCVMLVITTSYVHWFVEELSDTRGLNWEIPYW